MNIPNIDLLNYFDILIFNIFSLLILLETKFSVVNESYIRIHWKKKNDWKEEKLITLQNLNKDFRELYNNYIIKVY